MENNKDLGPLFKKRLATAEAEPSNNLWASIENTLDKKQKRKGGFLFFWSGLAILLAILLGFWYVLFSDSSGIKETEKIETRVVEIDSLHKNIQENENTITSKDLLDNEKDKNSSDNSNDLRTKPNPIKATYTTEITQKISKTDEAAPSDDASNRKKIGNTEQVNYPYDRTTVAKDKKHVRTERENNAPPDSSEPQQKENLAITDRKKLRKTDTSNESNESNESNVISKKADSVGAAIKPTTKKIVKEVAKKPKKEKEEPKRESFITVQAGSTMYGYLGGSTPFDPDLTSGQLRAGISYAYGALMNIPLNDRLIFRFGFRNTKLKFHIEEARSVISDNGNPTLLNAAAINRNGLAPVPEFITSLNSSNPVRIDLELTYQEVPFEFLYRLNDKKIKIDAILGVNAMLLNKNTVTISNEIDSYEIGSSNYLKKATLSSSIGIGFRYQVAPRIHIDLEPTFKYQFGANETGFEYLKPIILHLNCGATIKL